MGTTNRRRTIGLRTAGLAVAIALATGSVVGGAVGHGTAAAPPGPVDVGFAQDMLIHHQQAVLMSQLIRGRVEPRVGALADAVSDDQLTEIGQMRGYLELWGQPIIAAGPPMTWMDTHDPALGEHAHHGRPPAAMPGMATAGELRQLSTLGGRALEQLYLTLMIRHHAAGAEMGDQAARSANLPQVRDLAVRMSFHQREEIQGMRGILNLLAS